MKEKIIEMLGNGIHQTIVAKACGVTDGYVSQLMADENVRAQVAEARVADLDNRIQRDQKIESIEDAALERLEKTLAFETRPMNLVRIFQAMNGAKKARESEITGNNSGQPTAPLVQINISQEAAVAFKLSSDQQVVEVDGRSMATLPSRQLVRNLKERQESRPQITDASTAEELLQRIEQGIPQMSIAHVL